MITIALILQHHKWTWDIFKGLKQGKQRVLNRDGCSFRVAISFYSLNILSPMEYNVSL